MLTKLTCLRKFFILHISRNGHSLHSILKTYIIFQSSRAILLLYTSEICVFSNSLCNFAILNIIVLNFSTSKAQKGFYNNILLKCKKILKHFSSFFFILVIWQFNTFVIPMLYYTVILCFNTNFHSFVALIFNMYVKVICIREIFIHFMYNMNMDFLHIILRIFYWFMFGCLLFLVMLLFLCVFLVFCKYLICVLLVLMTVLHHHVLLFFHFHINIEKGADCLQNNNNVYANDLWLAFASVLFLKVWFNKTGIIKLRLFVFLLVYLLLSLHKQIKTPDHYEVIWTCCRYEFFTFDYIDTFKDIQTLITQPTIN